MVHTTSGRGSTPEEIAERALAKLIHVSDSAPEPIRMQAEAFKGAIRLVLIHYMHEVVQSHNTTIAARMNEAGFGDLVPFVTTGK